MTSPGYHWTGPIGCTPRFDNCHRPNLSVDTPDEHDGLGRLQLLSHAIDPLRRWDDTSGHVGGLPHLDRCRVVLLPTGANLHGSHLVGHGEPRWRLCR